MTLWVLWNVFEDAPFLRQTVPAVNRLVLGAQHVFVDGKYPQFPGAYDFSRDGTRGFAVENGVLLDAPVPEPEKRNVGLRYIDEEADTRDWVLQLDADEELTSITFPESAEGLIDFIRASDGHRYPRPHLWRWRPRIEYRGRHYWRYEGDERVADTVSAKGGVVCATGTHHDTPRTPEREEAKRGYYDWLQAHEGTLTG